MQVPSSGIDADVAAQIDWSVPTGYIRGTIRDRMTGAAGNLAVLSTGRLNLVAIYLRAGELVSNIRFYSGGTAAVTPTSQWFELRSAARTLLAKTVDDGSNAWAATTGKTLALTTPYRVPTSGLYYLGICTVAATVPSLAGFAHYTPVAAESPAIAGIVTGTVTYSTTPSTASAPSAQAAVPYALVS